MNYSIECDWMECYLIWHLLLLVVSRSRWTETASSHLASAVAPCCSSPSPRDERAGGQTSSSPRATPLQEILFSDASQYIFSPRDGEPRWLSCRWHRPPPPRCCGRSGARWCHWHPMTPEESPDHGDWPGAEARPPPPRCCRRCCPAPACCRGRCWVEPRQRGNRAEPRNWGNSICFINQWILRKSFAVQFVTFLNKTL